MNLVAAILAFIIYGGWAAWVNSEYGIEITMRAGLGQGIYAFFSTWFVTAIARKMLARFGPRWQGIFISFSAAFLVMLAFPLVIHSILMTPDIMEAILPGLIWGSGYIMVVIRLTCRTAGEPVANTVPKIEPDNSIDASG